MTERKPVDGAAPEVQAEFDRVWMALDGMSKQLYESGLSAARAGRLTPVIPPLAANPCSCDEALELRAKLREAKRERSELVKHHELLVDGVRRNYSERLAASEAECERLRVLDNVQRAVSYLDRAEAAESRLAAANALLEDAANWIESPQHVVAHGAKLCGTRIRSYLAGHAPRG